MATETKEEQKTPEQTEQPVRDRFYKDLEVAKKFMEPIHQKMDYYYELYRNRWEDGEFKISDLYAYVETTVPILTNNRTRASVRAEYPDYIKHAEGMNYILDHVFDTNNWDYKSQEVARMAEIYRSALAYTGFDPQANNGTGKLTITEINARWCYLDPAVTDLEDSSFFFYAQPMRASKVKKMYPSKAKEIGRSKDSSFLSSDGKTTGWFKTWVKSIAAVFSTSGNRMTRHEDSPLLPEMDEQEKRKNAVAFIHYWYRDEEDNWRVAYFADDVFLEDMANPFWHGRLPYDIYSPTKDILSALGVPMAEHIEHLNQEKNILFDLVIKHGKKTVDPPTIYNTTAGFKDPHALRDSGRDTSMIPVANPDFVPLNALYDYVKLSPLPGYVDVLPERMDAIIDKITGVNDSFRGMSQATSGKETQLKQEAAYTRIKTKIDNFELFNKNIAEKTIVNAMQFLNTTQTFRVKGDYRKFEGMDQTDSPFEVEPIPTGMDEEGNQQFDKREFFLYANPNEWTKVEEAPAVQEGAGELADGQEAAEAPEETPVSKEGAQEAYRILQMTVEIEAGSSLATSNIAKREEAMELFGAGAIDQQALLEAYDYPKMEEVMKRMSDAAAQQAEAEAANQQQQLEQQIMLKQMEQQAKLEQTQVQNQAKAAAQGQEQAAPEQPAQPQAPDIASDLDQLRQIAPEVANMTDEQLVQLLARMNQGG